MVEEKGKAFREPFVMDEMQSDGENMVGDMLGCVGVYQDVHQTSEAGGVGI
jgi:hypothetical protein